MVQPLLCDVHRWTTGQRDAKLRDARRGGGHGPQAADGGGGGCCDEVVSQGEKVSSLQQTDWHTVAFRRGNVALWTANKRRSRTIIHDVFLITSEFRSLWTRYWTTDFCCLTVCSRAVSGEPDTPPAGRAGQTWEAAAAQRSQVRRRAREEKVDNWFTPTPADVSFSTSHLYISLQLRGKYWTFTYIEHVKTLVTS